MSESALIVGAGSGLSASLARLCALNGMKVTLAARNIKKLETLAFEINAETIICDAIAETYLKFYRQDRSAWAWEIELRPWKEKF